MSVQTIAIIFACVGLVSAVVYHIVNFQKLRALKDIREKMDKK